MEISKIKKLAPRNSWVLQDRKCAEKFSLKKESTAAFLLWKSQSMTLWDPTLMECKKRSSARWILSPTNSTPTVTKTRGAWLRNCYRLRLRPIVIASDRSQWSVLSIALARSGNLRRSAAIAIDRWSIAIAAYGCNSCDRLLESSKERKKEVKISRSAPGDFKQFSLCLKNFGFYYAKTSSCNFWNLKTIMIPENFWFLRKKDESDFDGYLCKWECFSNN